MTLLALMFIGASAGSTGGSIKVVRHLLADPPRAARARPDGPPRGGHPGAAERRRGRRARAALDPRSSSPSTSGVFGLAAIGSRDRRSPRRTRSSRSFDAIGAVAACLGNVGPAFGFAGPFGSYEPFSDLSTGILIAAMWLGRLEIIPVAVLLSRNILAGVNAFGGVWPAMRPARRRRRLPAALQPRRAHASSTSASRSCSRPCSRLGYGEPVWPFLAGGGDHGGRRAPRSSTASRTAAHDRDPRGVPRRGADLGARRARRSRSRTCFGEPQLRNPIDAYFEAMSGMTTTGASVLTDIPALNQSMAMWRQFSQWLGGMGIVVLALAILPRLRVGGRQLMASRRCRAPSTSRSRPRSGTPRAALARLRRPDRADDADPRALRLDRRRPADERVTRRRRTPSRRCRPAASRRRRARSSRSRRPASG